MNTEHILTAPSHVHPLALRVAIVTETFAPEVNGVAMTLERITQALNKRGHSVQLVRPRQSKSDDALSREGWDEVLATGVPIPCYHGLQFGLMTVHRLVKLWQNHRPDIVHVATEGPLGWVAVSAARKLDIPLSSSFHTHFDSYSSAYGLGLLRRPIQAYLRHLHNRTEKTLVPSRTLMDELDLQGYSNLGLLKRGVAIQLFNPTRRSDALRKEWGAGAGSLVVTYVGRLAREKNVRLVIKAFAAIRTRVTHAILVITGDGPLRQSLEEQCPEAIFAGVRSAQDLACHYASADLFLFPSMSETFGNVVPEALASGLAVLAFDRAAAGELIQNEVNGILVAPGDEAAFVQEAVSLATNAHVREKLRSCASQSVSHLDWEAVHDGFVDTLRQVIMTHIKRPSQPQRAAAWLSAFRSKWFVA